MRALFGIVAVLVVGSGCFAATAVDVRRMKGWAIVVASDAIPSEQFAGKEFQALFEQATGIKLLIAAKPANATRNVFVGPSEFVAGGSAAISVDDLGEEGVRIRIAEDNIAIAGGRPRGTLYSVYEFFERYMGVRFLAHDHTHVPAAARQTKLPCETHSHMVPFSFRWSYYAENSAHPPFAARLRVNTVTGDVKLGGATRQGLINHSLGRQLPVAKYGKTHPEYFAMWRGKRDLDVHGGGPEPCVTHPDVADIVAKSVIAELDKSPNRRNISVSQNDNNAYCHCDRCEKINKAEGTPMGSHLAFVNAVAERVEAKHPKVKIGTLAYWYTRKCPKTIKPRPNMQIQLCSIECCTLHALDDPNCKRNREFCRDMRDWKKVCKDIWVWNYNTNFHMYDLPFPNLRSIGPNVRFFLRNNVKGLFMQANGNGMSGEFSDLRNYVISRCMWNPSLDSWKLAEEFCRLHYKKAAGPIIEHLKLIHDNAEQRGCHPGCFPNPKDVGLTPEVCLKSYALFEKALELADDDAVRARVEKASICAHRAVLEVCGGLRLADGVCGLKLPPGTEKAFDRYVELTKRHGMTMAAERMPVGDYIKQIKRAVKGHQAYSLENDVWRLTVLPGNNAKVVEMIHKPTGRNLFTALRSIEVGVGAHEEVDARERDRKRTTPFTAKQEGRTLTLTHAYPDGSTMVRRIRLTADSPDKVSFDTTITHQGDSPKRYTVKIRPEFDAGTTSDDINVLAAYVKRDRWVRFNDDWKKYHGPKGDLLKDAKGGGLAFYNHRDKFGMLLTYEPDQHVGPRLWWNPGASQVNLELMTAGQRLRKGGSRSYAYQFEYLSAPPK